MKIYLDNCCFNRPFDNQTQVKIYLETQAKLFIQQEILDEHYELVWSYILEYENMQNPYEIRRKSIIGWKEMAIETIFANEKILQYAEQLKSQNIRTKDALHISCAVFSKCHYFITTDKKLLNFNVDEIKIISPINFVNEMEVD